MSNQDTASETTKSRQQVIRAARSAVGNDYGIQKSGLNTRHTGTVVAVNQEHAAQDVGGRNLVVHRLQDLDKNVDVGAKVTVQYFDGKGKVMDRAKTREKDLGLIR